MYKRYKNDIEITYSESWKCNCPSRLQTKSVKVVNDGL